MASNIAVLEDLVLSVETAFQPSCQIEREPSIA